MRNANVFRTTSSYVEFTVWSAEFLRLDWPRRRRRRKNVERVKGKNVGRTHFHLSARYCKRLDERARVPDIVKRVHISSMRCAANISHVSGKREARIVSFWNVLYLWRSLTVNEIQVLFMIATLHNIRVLDIHITYCSEMYH